MGFGNYGWLEDDYDDSEIITHILNDECKHNWKEYTGFTEHYWFCLRCDTKIEENPNNDNNSRNHWWEKN